MTNHPNRNKTLKAFIAASNQPESLVRAVVKQIGGWNYFKQTAEDVTNHGADGGFSGFTYYTDTSMFFNNNRGEIITSLGRMAEELGETVIGLVKGFRCLCDATEDEIGSTLYGSKRDIDTHVANACAWYALEEVCRAYVDFTDNQ